MSTTHSSKCEAIKSGVCFLFAQCTICLLVMYAAEMQDCRCEKQSTFVLCISQVYDRVAECVSARSARPWDFDVSSVFAHIDAFLQRCRDLMEVCEAQMQFAPKMPLPVFGGLRGAEVKKSILDIQASIVC